MLRFALLALFATALPAVVVETTSLGTTPQGPSLLTAGDGQGNVILLVPPATPCSILQECSPLTLVKLDPNGRVLFRRPLPDPAARFQPTALALDRSGNILIAGVTPDTGLPTMRPLQPRHGGTTDIYLWQLSPDASSTTFASYLGGRDGEQPVSLAFDPTGQAVLVAQTSADFPFTAVEGPALTPNAPRLAVVRFTPGRIAYALGLPFGPPPAVAFGPDGTAFAISFEFATGPTLQAPPSLIREIRPDGTHRPRPLSLPPGTTPSRVLPSPDGGYWLAGQAVGDVLPTTPGALQTQSTGFTYQRWEREQIITPPGPIRSLAVRQLAVDRADENRIYAATLRGIARSDDNGWTWEIVNGSAPLRNTLSLVAGPGRLWALTLGIPTPVLHSSTDAGLTWTAVPLPEGFAPVAFPGALTAHPTQPDTLFLVNGATLLSTRNAGQSWTLRNFPNGINAVAVDERALAVQTVAYGTRFFPSVYTLHWSEDGGENFPKTLLTQSIPSLRFDPNEPGRLYTADFNRFARTSPETFPEFETLAQPGAGVPPVTQFGFQTGLPRVIFGVLADGRLARSEDAGRTWRPASAAPAVPGFNILPTQLHVAAGGVVHLAFPLVPESFLGKFTATGDPVYLTYLGGRGSTNFASLTRTATGLIVASGQTFGEFPGERLGGNPGPFRPDPAPPTPGLFAIAFQEDASLVYSAVLASSAPTNLIWSGPGAGPNIVLVGTAFSPDFPGFPPGGGFFAGPTLFMSRIRP